MTRIRTGPSIHIEGWELVPVERVSVHAAEQSGLVAVVAGVAPVALLARAGGVTRALTMDGTEVDSQVLMTKAER